MSIFITTSMALLFHRRGAGTLLAFGDHSAALARWRCRPRRSSAQGCWDFE
jgi:hypothetical protein